MVELLPSFPYNEPREIQAQALEKLSEHWNDFDVFVLSAPTAFGKTAVAKTLLNALHQVSVITPTNLLVDQFRAEFPDTCTLSRLDGYRCAEWQRPCSTTRGKLKGFCRGCPASKDLATARYRKGPGIYNYHIYISQKLYRQVLVVDEAHNLIPFIRDRLSVQLWQHDYKYPSNMHSLDQIRTWLEKLPASKKRHQKIQLLEEAVESPRPQYMPVRGRDWFNGKGTLRGESEERDCLRLLPVDIRGAPPLFWPREVEKIVLLSATISRKDIETLGLDRKRVLYVNCESPIPADSRPIVAHNIASVNRGNLEQATTAMARYIQDVLAPAHAGQKGIIHATYQQATVLSDLLGGQPRYMFHTRSNKSDVYHRFRDLPAESGAILVASGMYEGIDLPEDLGRWQVITKVPWPNLGNPAVKYLSDLDSELYIWECLKMMIQACGRICRTPGDFGVSYVTDYSFSRLMRESIQAGLVPAWYLDGIEAGGGLD